MEATQTNPSAGVFVAAFLVPPLSLILSVVWFAKNNAGAGFALFLTGFLASIFWLMILVNLP